MYKWTTTTIINSNEDFTVKGSPLFSGQAATTSESGREIPANLFVKRVAKFNEPNVKAIYVRRHNEAELAQVKIDLSGVKDAGVYRIAVYVGLQGSANEYYANDFVFKGKPFFIEFELTDSANGVLAEKVVKIARKYQQMVYETPLIKVTNEGNTLVLDAIDEYQRFRVVELQKYDSEAGLHQSCCSNAGDFVTIDTIDEDSPLNAGKITWGESKGKEGFGTYRHLIKDLRLPTMENRRWGAIIQDETPIVGATYDQYIIHYCATVGVQGLAHVGDMVQAATTHVFYVNTTLKNDWEAALANIGTPIEVTDDKATIDPYKISSQGATPVMPVPDTTAVDALSKKIETLEKRVDELEA